MNYNEEIKILIDDIKKSVASLLNEVICPKNSNIFGRITGCKVDYYRMADFDIPFFRFQIGETYYDIRERSTAYTLFHLLCNLGYSRLVELILKNIDGIHINTQFVNGEDKLCSPLASAERNGRKKIVALLNAVIEQTEKNYEIDNSSPKDNQSSSSPKTSDLETPASDQNGDESTGLSDTPLSIYPRIEDDASSPSEEKAFEDLNKNYVEMTPTAPFLSADESSSVGVTDFPKQPAINPQYWKYAVEELDRNSTEFNAFLLSIGRLLYMPQNGITT